MQHVEAQFMSHGQTYVVEQLDDVYAVLSHAEFLYEGWCELKELARADVSWEDYLQRLLAITSRVYNGAVFVFKSKNQKTLGYVVLQEDTESRSKPTMLVYAGYSTSKAPHSGSIAMEFVCKWAAQRGFLAVHAQSRRINGASMRYFRKTLRFKPISVVFEKVLV
jgi:hypothetical protein